MMFNINYNISYLIFGIVVFDDVYCVSDIKAQLVAIFPNVFVSSLDAIKYTRW